MSGTSSPEQRAKLAREYWAGLEQRPSNLTPSRTYVNAATTGYYTGNQMRTARADADQHFQFTSAGVVAQIRRAL